MVMWYAKAKTRVKTNMDSQKQQVIERLKQANNILVTVSSSPSVDQLSACIGLTLALNKLGKHATAVFSGDVPSTIEFLQPEKTLEKNTNSLQDFIIALDKSKADKLRYKVEDRMVKIFITPYRTSISDKDLEFSQGDFNVDVVVALGVHSQQELDQAITSHGRILHDATVISVNVTPGGELGSINWLDGGASSLSEMGVQLVDALEKNTIDGQIATAFLTGIVAATDRFSNQKTSPQTMSLSAELMSFGANQQLVATKLEAPEPPKPAPIPELKPQPPKEKTDNDLGLPPVEPPKPKDDGTIEIEHTKDEQPAPPAPHDKPDNEPPAPQIHIDDQGQLQPLGGAKPTFDEPMLPPEPPLPTIKKEDSSKFITEPPSFERPPITANINPENDEDRPALDQTPKIGLLNREPLPAQPQDQQPAPQNNPFGSFGPSNTMPWQGGPNPMPPVTAPRTVGPASALPDVPSAATPAFSPSPAMASPTEGNPTLAQIEQNVGSPHLGNAPMQPPTTTGFAATPPSPASTPPTTPASEKTEQPEATSVEDARSLVEQAINGDPNAKVEPPASLNAQPLNFESAHDASADQMDVPLPHLEQPAQGMPPMQPMQPPQVGMPPQTVQPTVFTPPTPGVNPTMPQMPEQQIGTIPNMPTPGTPPSVPPPMMPPTFPSGQ